MKIITLGVLLFTSTLLFGQKPEKVYSIVKEQRDSIWYVTQEGLWAKEVKKNKNNTEAWTNYYEAVRAQKNLLPWESKKRKDYDEKLNTIADGLFKDNPKTFDANFYMYRHYGGLGTKDNEKYFEYLKKAYEIDPLDSRTYVDFMIRAEISGEQENFSHFCQKFHKANEMAPYFYNWSYNLLTGLEDNAILFTAGDNDTYSCWMMQEVIGHRKDVQIINTSLFMLDDYRIRVFKELGLEPLNFRIDKSKSMEEYQKNSKLIFEMLFKNTKDYPVYVSSTAARQFDEDYGDSLYLTGLAYKYASSSFDNSSIIRRNIEKRYRLDYLDASFGFHIQNSNKPQMDATYLPAFVKLYKHYTASEEIEKAKRLEKLLKAIATKSDQLERVEKLMAE